MKQRKTRKKRIEPFYVVLSPSKKIQGAFPFTKEGKKLATDLAEKLSKATKEIYSIK